MNRSVIKLALLSVAFSVCCVSTAWGADMAKEPPHAMISIYHVAPGRQLEFLKWLAAREAIANRIGMPVTQLYAHLDGDSWDYLTVGPMASKEQDKMMDEAMKKAGLTTGFKASLEIRQYLASHTDTYVVGPVKAADLVTEASK